MSAASERGREDRSTRAVVVDDSRFMRTLIQSLLEEGGVEVVGEASDGSEAVDAVREHDPDVVTMDIEMPAMNGLEAVEAIMRDHPTPVLMLSAHAEEDADVTFEALDRGAVDFVTKPGGEVTSSMPRVKRELVEKVESAARVDLSASARVSDRRSTGRRTRGTDRSGGDATASSSGGSTARSGSKGRSTTTSAATESPSRPSGPSGSRDGPTGSSPSGPSASTGRKGGAGASSRTRTGSRDGSQSKADTGGASAATTATYPDVGTLVVGASTGGPAVVERVLGGLPREANLRILVVQHMPEGFTTRFASRLDGRSAYSVTEAEYGERIEPGEARVAPGGHHLLTTSDRNGRLKLELTETEPIHGVRPAIDVTMASTAETVEGPLCAVLLTGMGRDGVDGLQRISAGGGHTIAQDEETSAIFGMPRRAIESGCVADVAPAERVAENALQYFEEE